MHRRQCHCDIFRVAENQRIRLVFLVLAGGASEGCSAGPGQAAPGCPVGIHVAGPGTKAKPMTFIIFYLLFIID